MHPNMSATASSGDYEICDEIVMKKFSMEENVCYEGIKPCSSNLKNSASVTKDSEVRAKQNKFINRMLVALFLAVLALLLGTVCACAVFALEISKLKYNHAMTEQRNMISQLIMSSSLFDEKIQRLNTTIDSKLAEQMNLISQNFYEKIQLLNTSIDSNLAEQMNLISQNFYEKIQLLNTSIDSNLAEQMNLISQNFYQLLNTSIDSNLAEQMNLISQLIMSSSLFDEKMQHLNTSIGLFYNQFRQDLHNTTQQLNASAVLFHREIDEKIEILSTSSQDQFRQLDNRTLELSRETQVLSNNIRLFHPLINCAAYPPSSPSGYYMREPSIGQPAVRVYCDFNSPCGCDGSSTWTRVAFLNMSDPNEVCPTNWETYTSPVRACGNGPDTGCDSVIYPTFEQAYSRVCGRVLAYQHGDTVAFRNSVSGMIDGNYLDGVSITHGSTGSRQHIWSFASALGDFYVTSQPSASCSCSSSNTWPYSTGFVGNDYFCDTGSRTRYTPPISFPNDPLWDGAGCGAISTCCTFNSPPWFCKTLQQPTTDDLEVRICNSDTRRDTPIQLMEIFVQ